MNRATLLLSWIVRLCGTVQLVLGALIWFAPTRNYVPIHMLVGALLVVALLVLAVLGLRARVRWPMPTFTIVWSLALLMFGARHAGMLIGPLHWVIRLTHVLMGIIAIALGQRLAQSIPLRGAAVR